VLALEWEIVLPDLVRVMMTNLELDLEQRAKSDPETRIFNAEMQRTQRDAEKPEPENQIEKFRDRPAAGPWGKGSGRLPGEHLLLVSSRASPLNF
jgi:hypothetical protein